MKKLSIIKRLALLLLCASMLLGLCACGETRMSQRQVFAMDTVMTLTAYGKNAERRG